MNNFFKLLELPEIFSLNDEEIESAYFSAQRKYHPDKFVSKPQQERAKAAAVSAQINKAYNTLKSHLKRAIHLLEINGVEPLEKPDSETLLEIMELQEKAENGDNNLIKQTVENLIFECINSIEKAFNKNDFQAAKSSTIRLSYLYKIPL